MSALSGFSKLNREQRINYIVAHSELSLSDSLGLYDYQAPPEYPQRVFSDMIENYIGNFPLPMGVVPNMVINGETLIVPFVTEESSVIAAASKAARYWAQRGGFRTSVKSMTKKGQVHFTWNGKQENIKLLFPFIRKKLLTASLEITEKMRQRGGGITEIVLIDKTAELTDYYQIEVSFLTADAMGANFINSCLEKIASVLLQLNELKTDDCHVGIIMSILSNYSPECKVNCLVECPITMLTDWSGKSDYQPFVTKFKLAVDIANLDISRAVTHNKGIFNGIDAVLLATGNDLRATAAAGHAYASRNGIYKSLTTISLDDDIFRYELELPMTVGTVGGITQIHPTVKNVLSILNYPDARMLMMIAAASGVASNFAAVASLTTTGIQQGHMKMHLTNILNQLNVTNAEREAVSNFFSDKTVSYSAVENFIGNIRNKI
jgi:hydroxymethylglutaryl-CoA reductase